MASEREHFLADTFHQVAVGSDHVSPVVDHVIAEHRGEMPLGDCHANSISESLSEGAGGGLDAGRMAEFRMSGGDRAKLAELLNLIDGHRFVAGKIKQCID